MTPPLTDAARASDLAPLGETGWRAVPDRDALRKVLKFRNFSQAWGFMSRAALAAEHKYWHLGIIWTLQNHPRVLAKVGSALAGDV